MLRRRFGIQLGPLCESWSPLISVILGIQFIVVILVCVSQKVLELAVKLVLRDIGDY